jgi:hypothetical protein
MTLKRERDDYTVYLCVKSELKKKNISDFSYSGSYCKITGANVSKGKSGHVSVTAIRNDTDNWVEVQDSGLGPSTTVPVQNI